MQPLGLLDLRGCLVFLLALGLPTHALAGRPTSAKIPRFDAVKRVLCPIYKLTAGACAASSFDPPRQIDLDGDGRTEWIYVNRRGPLKICFVRHACFTLLEKRGRRWRAALSSMGGTIAFFGRSRHVARRDLVVTAANSACERSHTLLIWLEGRYRPRRTTSCAADDCDLASAAVIKRSKRDRLCRAPKGEIILQ